ncbi:MAG: hypothetical protein Kow0081_1090 [Candidatus Dojkabacteria bacterium]
MKIRHANESQSKFKRNTYTSAIGLFILFSITAVVGAFVGNFVDNHFDIKPYGSLMVLFVFYIISWTMALFIYSQIKNAAKEEKDKQLAIRHVD